MSLADAYRTRVGHYPAMWMVWSDWGGPTGTFPTATMNAIKTRGMVPVVNWEPLNPSAPTDCANWSLDKIIDGSHDAYITAWAQAAKAYGGTVLVRFAHGQQEAGIWPRSWQGEPIRIAPAADATLRGAKVLCRMALSLNV